LWKARSGSWWSLTAKLARKALRLGGFLRRRGEPWPTLRSTASHDAAKVIARAVADLGGWRGLMTAYRRMAASGDFQISSEGGDFSLVSGQE
jgi:hypothetical protein